METIGQTELWSYFNPQVEARRAKSREIREGCGHQVISFLDLAKKVAELQFRNPDYVLLFRGQPDDYRNRNRTTSLKPSLFRSKTGAAVDPPSHRQTRRFEILKDAEA